MSRWLTIILLLFAGPALAAPGQERIAFGDYYALVIGNNDYEFLSKLTTATSDAAAVAEVLRSRYAFKDVRLLLNATRSDILEALNKYRADLTENDNLLIYYAGHGYVEPEADEGFWQPVDARGDDDTKWVSNSTLTRFLRTMSARHVMIVADSCYSGSLLRSGGSGPPVGAERNAWLRRMAAKRARTALSSGGLEPVSDRGSNGHSVFANAFLTALRENGDVLDGQTLYQRIKRQVVLNAQQTPEYADVRNATHEGGDFLFVPIVVAPQITVQAPASTGTSDKTAVELAFWDSVKDSDDPAMVEAYLTRYPEGTFAPLAKLKVEKLKHQPPAQTAMAPPPAPATPPKLTPVEATYVAVKNANVRAGPTVDSERVTTLAAGSEIHVAGRTEDEQWLAVERDGKPLGYVYAPLLRDEATAPPPATHHVAMVAPPAPASPSTPAPGTVIRDCEDCPELVVVPAGSFLMGSPADEAERDSNEGPQHRVTIAHALAVGRYEVTVAEYAAFVTAKHRPEEGGCYAPKGGHMEPDDQATWRHPGFEQSDLHPAVCVSWRDAHSYVGWLQTHTGQPYRLLSEAEWEYVARAGAVTARPWGDDVAAGCAYANITDTSTVTKFVKATATACHDGYVTTAPVGSFSANRFGVFDMIGNAWEWTADCWHESYDGAPADGAAWAGGDCQRRALRGGGWLGKSRSWRSAARLERKLGAHSVLFGFRVARDLQ